MYSFYVILMYFLSYSASSQTFLSVFFYLLYVFGSLPSALFCQGFLSVSVVPPAHVVLRAWLAGIYFYFPSGFRGCFSVVFAHDYMLGL